MFEVNVTICNQLECYAAVKFVYNSLILTANQNTKN